VHAQQVTMLEEIQQRWGPEWLVWRSRNNAGQPNEWCATRRGVGGAASMTLMERTADKLEEALREQRDLAERGTPPSVAYPS
jgi:hypothetical protein